MNLKLKNIKSILLVVINTEFYALMMDLVSLDNNFKLKITIFVVKCLKKLRIEMKRQ